MQIISINIYMFYSMFFEIQISSLSWKIKLINSLRSVCSGYKFHRDFQSSLDYLYSEILSRIDSYGLK